MTGFRRASTRMVLAISALLVTPAPNLNAQAAAADTPGLYRLAAAKKKLKKKKKGSSDTDSFGPEGIDAVADNDNGIGIHREQEGVDGPYHVEITGETTLAFLTTKRDDRDPSSSTNIEVTGSMLFLMGKMSIGPEVRYGNSSYSTTYDSGIDKTTTVKTTVSSLMIGPLFKWYFGNLDRDLNVPFVLAGISYMTGESKSGDSKNKSSGTYTRFGGGINMFLDSNIALAPQAQYTIQNSEYKSASGDTEKSNTSGFQLAVALSTFL